MNDNGLNCPQYNYIGTHIFMAMTGGTTETEHVVSRQIVLDPDAKIAALFEEYAGWGQPQEEASSVPDCTAYTDLSGSTGYVLTSRVNDVGYINKTFERINREMSLGDTLIGHFEPSHVRKHRVLSKYPGPLAWTYYTLHFIVQRVLPRLRLTQGLYFKVTKGKNRVLPLPEVLGRLVSCGFEILGHVEHDGVVYFVTQKADDPRYPASPSYGPLFRMRRVGQGGKLIGVYKLRTMHPYAEFLQAYVLQQGDLASGGKFKDDFRVTTWGRFMRKTWLDELPMLVNLIRGELKLVGVRPLSRHYLSLYPELVQHQREGHKPGLVPPFYADLPETLDEIVASEVRYMNAYERNPLRTDLRYLGRALYNILIRRARSQ